MQHLTLGGTDGVFTQNNQLEAYLVNLNDVHTLKVANLPLML